MGVAKGDRVVTLLPNTVEHRIWVQAAKRIGAVYLCLPVTISLTSLAERVSDCGAKVVITSTSHAPLEGATLKAVALAAVTGFVGVGTACAAVRRVLDDFCAKAADVTLSVDEAVSALEYNFGGQVAVRPSCDGGSPRRSGRAVRAVPCRGRGLWLW